MTRLMAFKTGLTAALLWTSAADAASVTNRDDKDHKVTIVEADRTQDHILKPQGVLEGVCPKGCILRLDDSEDDEYEIESSDVVSIEEGFLYYDEPADATPPVQGGGSSSPSSKP